MAISNVVSRTIARDNLFISFSIFSVAICSKFSFVNLSDSGPKKDKLFPIARGQVSRNREIFPEMRVDFSQKR